MTASQSAFAAAPDELHFAEHVHATATAMSAFSAKQKRHYCFFSAALVGS